MPKSVKLFARLTTLLALLALCFVFGASKSIAHAQAIHQSATVDTSNCKSARGSNYVVECLSPVITLPHPSTCPGQQYFTATDGYGKAIDWTYTDAHNLCVLVNYYPTPSYPNCTVWFYVPNGNATATFTYFWENGTTPIPSGSFNENPVDGWQELISHAGPITDLFFSDNQNDGALQLGWGSNSSDSLKVICSA